MNCLDGQTYKYCGITLGCYFTTPLTLTISKWSSVIHPDISKWSSNPHTFSWYWPINCFDLMALNRKHLMHPCNTDFIVVLPLTIQYLWLREECTSWGPPCNSRSCSFLIISFVKCDLDGKINGVCIHNQDLIAVYDHPPWGNQIYQEIDTMIL